MRPKVPTPGWALLLFLFVLVLNIVINAVLLATVPDLGILLGELLAILIPTALAVFVLRADARTTLRLRLPSTTDLLLALPLAASLVVINDQLSNLTSQVFPIPEEFRESIVGLLRAETAYEWIVRILGLAVGGGGGRDARVPFPRVSFKRVSNEARWAVRELFCSPLFYSR